MAYLSILYSAPLEEIEAFRNNSSKTISKSKNVNVSHLIAESKTLGKLGQILWEALDNDAFLDPGTKQKRKNSLGLCHSPDEVKRIFFKLSDAWTEYSKTVEFDDWSIEQINLVLDIFEHAANRDECIAVGLL